MLEIDIPERLHYIEELNEFLNIKGAKLQLEHSLLSLKKWEQKWHKPFLESDKNYEEIIDYIKCMTLNKVTDDAYNYFPEDAFMRILDYIKDPMTATWFNNVQEGKSKAFKNKTVTAELIYYWMIILHIPFECQKWHLNQLITLIKLVEVESAPKKKMPMKEEREMRARLNAERKAKYNTKG